ncbi:hypothetical protein EA473_09200 [Natrarchaeobius chitinivorans]|uniref:Uncharacterized protein n=1 Tax=Natrarchaeobius chitinivorans TaxID=1679083 RepID=A0A3N6M0K5_NATCH|nr:hypothetical protein EA473_09200 [Natrarchaeobius chitinivorans]
MLEHETVSSIKAFARGDVRFETNGQVWWYLEMTTIGSEWSRSTAFDQFLSGSASRSSTRVIYEFMIRPVHD